MNPLLLDNPYLFEYFGVVLLLLLIFGLTSLSKKYTTLKAVSGVGLILVPILYFYAVLAAHVVNVPFTDDFNLLETVQKFRQETNATEAVKLLFEQVNQHRFAFERLVMLAMVALTGTVDIRVQIMLGNFFLLGILYLIYLIFRKEDLSWYYFIPVPYVLFNLVFYENAYWGIAALQNTPLIFFAFLCFYALNRNTTGGLFQGLLAAVITTFISGTGMLTLLIGAMLLVFQQRYRSLLLWGVITVGTLLFYFLFDYTFIQSNSENLWRHPIYNALLLLGFWGNALYLDIPHPLYPAFYPDMVACAVLGLFIGVVVLAWALRYYVIIPRNRPSYWFVLGAFLFMLGTGAMFVLSRPLDTFFMYGGSIFSRRYMLFGVVLLALTYAALVVMSRRFSLLKNSVTVLSLLAFVVLNFQSYFQSLVQLRRQQAELMLDGYYWKNYTTFLTAGHNFGDVPFWNHPTRMKELVRRVEDGGLSNLYASDRFPDAGGLAEISREASPFGGTLEVRASYRMSDLNRPAEYIRLEATDAAGWAPSWFLLVSPQHSLLLPVLPQPHNWSEFVTTRRYYDNRYGYGLYRSKLPSGSFRVLLLPSNPGQDGKWEAESTRKKLVLSASRNGPVPGEARTQADSIPSAPVN